MSDLDSGVGLNLGSGAAGGSRGGHSRALPSLARQPDLASLQQRAAQLDNDNHSSEEELEDIIGNSGKKKVYTVAMGTGGPSGTGGQPSVKAGSGGGTRCSSTNPEKRKWSEVTRSEGEEEAGGAPGHSAILRAPSGSSGDEEVSGLMDSRGSSAYTPVQFCTSPPLDVYKPRKSQSPPPKLFHMSVTGAGAGAAGQTFARMREGQRPSGAFRPRPRQVRPGGGVVEYSNLPARQEEEAGPGREEGQDEAGHRSPNKRHRSTPKPHNIQRPCLDFEKMQQVRMVGGLPSFLLLTPIAFFQIKTKVVTSWRQGTELSLFCW